MSTPNDNDNGGRGSGRGRGRGGRGGRGGRDGRGGRGDRGGRGGRRGDNNGSGTGTKPKISKDNNGSGAGTKPKMSKVDRKLGKRQKQLATMQKKAQEEDAYFRQCQKEAQKQSYSNSKKQVNKAREEEMFGKQIVKGINFGKYDAIQVEVKLPPTAASNTTPAAMDDFSKLPHLTPQLKKNIEMMKYTQPTPIQKNAIPLAMNGEDLMCCAQTGSGKTCAFLLPVVAALAGQQAKNGGNNKQNKSGLEPAKPKCIVLAPTRELASQIELEAEKLTYGLPSVHPVVVYGGATPRPQLKELARASGNPNIHMIVVATPGRLTDFVDRNIVDLSEVQYLILDEADRCLDMGFEPQIRKLVQRSGMTPKEKRQTFLFSATFAPAIQKLAAEFLRPYVWIAVGRVGSTVDSIKQVLVKATADKRNKLELVVEALQKGPKGRTLIFVQKKRSATWLKKQLSKGGPDAGAGPKHSGGATENPNKKQKQQQQPFQGKEIRFAPIPAEEIHGDRSQSQRESALEKFRSGKCTVLVATDVAARGLDIPGTFVILDRDEIQCLCFFTLSLQAHI